MTKSILDKIMNAGIPIIKPGSVVKLARTNEDVYIRYVTLYQGDTLVYNGYIFKDDNQRQELTAIYPTEIKDYDKLISRSLNLISINEETVVDVNSNIITGLGDVYSESISTRLAIYNHGVLYSNPGILENYKNPEDAYRNLLIKFELRTASSYGYLDGNLILPNDTYIVLYHRHNPIDAFLPVEYITREVELKPFIKRMFNTLLYGRSHSSNFKYIESSINYTNRLLEITSNQQKEKGYIQYNRAEITI